MAIELATYVYGFRCLCGQFHTETYYSDYVVWQCSNCRRKWRILEKGAQLLPPNYVPPLAEQEATPYITSGGGCPPVSEPPQEGDSMLKKEVLVLAAQELTKVCGIEPAIDVTQDEKGLTADIREVASELLKAADKAKLSEATNHVVEAVLGKGTEKKGEETMKGKKDKANGQAAGKGVEKAKGKKEQPKAKKGTAVSGKREAYLAQKIKLLVKENPRREGSASHKIFAKYRTGMTVAEALKAGVRAVDLRWDVNHKFIEIR